MAAYQSPIILVLVLLLLQRVVDSNEKRNIHGVEALGKRSLTEPLEKFNHDRSLLRDDDEDNQSDDDTSQSNDGVSIVTYGGLGRHSDGGLGKQSYGGPGKRSDYVVGRRSDGADVLSSIGLTSERAISLSLNLPNNGVSKRDLQQKSTTDKVNDTSNVINDNDVDVTKQDDENDLSDQTGQNSKRGLVWTLLANGRPSCEGEHKTWKCDVLADHAPR